MHIRRILAACALLILIAVHPEFIALPATFFRWAELQRTLSARPNGSWPQYPLFLEGVHAHTQRGDRIGIAVPGMRSAETYLYAFYRAGYLLADREVLPIFYGEKFRADTLAKADYVAAWQTAAPPGRVVWAGSGGVLVGRR